MKIHPAAPGLVAAILVVAVVQATAVEAARAAPPVARMEASGVTRAQSPAGAPDLGVALDRDALDAMRGGDDTHTTTNTIDVHGDVGGNTATDIVTGTNSIDGGSFANAAGIATVIQNTGANVLIQNAMVVNLQFVEPGP
jgi:hypothetical protein